MTVPRWKARSSVAGLTNVPIEIDGQLRDEAAAAHAAFWIVRRKDQLWLYRRATPDAPETSRLHPTARVPGGLPLGRGSDGRFALRRFRAKHKPKSVWHSPRFHSPPPVSSISISRGHRPGLSKRWISACGHRLSSSFFGPASGGSTPNDFFQ
jgi:hypothetical protein